MIDLLSQRFCSVLNGCECVCICARLHNFTLMQILVWLQSFGNLVWISLKHFLAFLIPLLFSTFQTTVHLPWSHQTVEAPPPLQPTAPPPHVPLPSTPPQGLSSPPLLASGTGPPPQSANPSWSPPEVHRQTPITSQTPTRKWADPLQCKSLRWPHSLLHCLPKTSAVREWSRTYRGHGRSKARQPSSPAL